MILHDAVGRAEAKASAFADGFGGVERIEDAARLANAGAGVGEFEDHFIALLASADDKRTTANFFHGVHGIAYNLQAALEKLIGVAPNAGKVGRDFRIPANASALEVQLFHLYRAACEGADVDERFVGGRLLREAEQS